jgi:hypothetical protein
MPAIKTGKKTEKYTTEFKVKAACSGATKPIVNTPVLVAPLIRVLRPLVFRRIFPWRQFFL